MKGLATSMLSERLQSIDLRSHLRRRRTYPGMFPVLHLDHIYYEGTVEVVKLELPRTRLSLMASDHLPLVAELRIKFA
jgi:endonuclease/exonuclease/phosphatase family metal-dependent hydrolase